MRYEFKHLSDHVLCNPTLTQQEKIDKIIETLNNLRSSRRDEDTGQYYETNPYLDAYFTKKGRDRYIAEERHIIVNQSLRDGWTLLLICTQQGFSEVARWLVENQGANVNLGNDFNFTPLFVAAGSGRLGFMNYFIGRGADINSRARSCGDSHHGSTSTSTTPLHNAVRYGQLQAVKFLLQAGARTDIKMGLDEHDQINLEAAIRQEEEKGETPETSAGLAHAKARLNAGKTPAEYALYLQEIVYALNAGEEHPDANKYLGVLRWRDQTKIPTVENLEEILGLFRLADSYTYKCYQKSQNLKERDSMTAGEKAAAKDYVRHTKEMGSILEEKIPTISKKSTLVLSKIMGSARGSKTTEISRIIKPSDEKHDGPESEDDRNKLKK